MQQAEMENTQEWTSRISFSLSQLGFSKWYIQCSVHTEEFSFLMLYYYYY